MPGGRPTSYDPAYCDAIVAHMRDGASVLSFAAEIDVARSTINKWAEEHPEFSEALSRGKAACAAWWEKQGRAVAEKGGAGGQAAIIQFGLRNMGREEWQEKVAVVGGNPAAGDHPVQLDVTGLSAATLAELAAAKVSGE